MEREVGGGIGMGKTCKLKDVSFQCMTKFTTNKKKKKKKKVISSSVTWLWVPHSVVYTLPVLSSD